MRSAFSARKFPIQRLYLNHVICHPIVETLSMA
jgi:hypothetical protein